MVALSGGADSMCLTYLLRQYRDLHRPDLDICAITIDHGYRRNSGLEAMEIGEIMNQWGIRHQVHKLDYDTTPNSISNFEETARTKRYLKFRDIGTEWGSTELMVAHNHDDQLETYLQRLEQNSTLFGLRGLRSNSLLPVPQLGPFRYHAPIMISRPLLPFSKHDIIETCRQNHVPWFEDYTNADIHLTKRNMYRYLLNEHIPRCSQYDIINKYNLSQSHQTVLRITDDIRHAVDDLWQKYSSRMELVARDSVIYLNVDSIEQWDEFNCLVWSRFLYELIYPISASKHYYWSYSKLLYNFMPQLQQFVASNNCHIKLTYLNVLFDITKSHTKWHTPTLKFTLSRQPVPEPQKPGVKLTLHPNDNWKLFDGRYWLRPINTSIDIDIVAYDPKLHRNSLKSQFTSIPKIWPGTPIVQAHTLHAVPTHGLNIKNINIEWFLKDNIFGSRKSVYNI